MKLGLCIILSAAAWLMPIGSAWAGDPPPPSERLVAEGWAILNGQSLFEPFCDRPAQAQEKFKRAIEYDPNNASAYRGWGRAGADLARCPLSGPLTWADTVGLTEPPPLPVPPLDLPTKVIVDAAYKYRRAADLAPGDYLAWADWGRSLMSLAALEPETSGRLEMVELATEKYGRAEALMPDDAELRLVRARGLLTVLAAEDDPSAWPGLWDQCRRAYYDYIDLSPDQAPKDGGVSPRLAAWSVFGREVSQAARDFREPRKARLLLAAVIEAMRLLVVAKPDYDLSLDVNSLSRAYLDLMALTPDEEPWRALLGQAGDLAKEMVELDPDNPVIDFVLWNWRRLAEAEPDPVRRSAMIDKALTVVELLGEKQRAKSKAAPAPKKAVKAQERSSAKGKVRPAKGRTAEPGPVPAEEPPAEVRIGDGLPSRMLMVLAAVMERGDRRDELLARADREFAAAVSRAEGEDASRLRLIWAQELMELAVLESDSQSAAALLARADEQFRLSLESTAHPALTLIAWSTTVEVTPAYSVPGGAGSSDIKLGVNDGAVASTAVEATPDGGSSGDAASFDNKPEAAVAGAPGDGAVSDPAPAEVKEASVEPAVAEVKEESVEPAPVEVKEESVEPAAAEVKEEPVESAAAEVKEESVESAAAEYKNFEGVAERYRVAAALPGGEMAFDYLGVLYFKRARAEKNPALAEELWLKALESFRRAALPGEGEGLKIESAFRLGQIYATLAAQGQPAARACLKDSGHSCLAAALRVQREVFAALPGAINASVSAGDPVIRPDLTPALRPRPDPTRLGPPLSPTRLPSGDANTRRRLALTRTAADGFFQILMTVSLDPPPRPSRRSVQDPPPPPRKALLQGSDRALLAALYRLAAGYRQMDPEYKPIYLHRAEFL